MTMTNELKACPFCASPAIISESIGHEGKEYVADCTECSAFIPYNVTEEEAIAAWNRRAPVERQAPEWISVEDRLPPKFDEVLVWPHPSDQSMTATLESDGWHYQDYIHNWGYNDERCKVTHWMPLPASPSAAPSAPGRDET